ncbi:MAG: hypothetical protein CMG14_01020 [Candidatus Marinimicrobia bacterium]|nr:hypothetical protein [Candidatus Neomarinimicrobiota bacterium]|tara:strand:- start:1218 stop:1664 length:447 start_codon:yes stop_codon:yes gene_type:complete
MINLFKNINFLLLGRLILGYVFIYASIDKIIDPVSFSDIIDNYHITPVLLNNLFALFIPWLELIIGLCLIFNIKVHGASFLSILLLLWFIFILTQAIFRGINVECGCFDLNTSNLDDLELRKNMIKRIFEDIVFLGISLYVNIKSKNN